MSKIKVLVAFSGGKDSQAALIWAINESGFLKENIEAVFCDTGWEHEITYSHIKKVTDDLGVNLIVLKSKKYNGFVDLAKKKGRFPSTKARFCTEELKTKPMIDYILDECKTHVVIIQGIRADESKSRSLMNKQCSYFRYYFEPYGKDEKGKLKFSTYRKRDVLKFREEYLDDVIRPCFDWTGQEVMNYILTKNQKPNSLYYTDAKRVGCFPCIMCSHSEIKAMVKHHPKYIKRLKEAEAEIGRTFFPPNYIRKKYMSNIDPKTGKRIPSVDDVLKYVADRNPEELSFDENIDRRCMSFYGICE